MGAEQGVITTQNIDITVREIDFVNRFTTNIQALQQVLGVVRPIRKEAGSKIRVLKTSGTLAKSVAEGEKIGFSSYDTEVVGEYDASIEKYATAVTIEAVNEFGYDVAVARKDQEFLSDLQGKILGNFFTFLGTGSLPVTGATTLRQAMAKAAGAVQNKFRTLHKSFTQIVGFANINDVYDYIGNESNINLTIQSEFGFNYVKNFLGYGTVILGSDSEVKPGTFIATPIENVVMYYVDPADSAYARMGLPYTTSGTGTNLIGFHVEGNYQRAQGESYAIMGLSIFAELLDGIAVANFQ